MRPYIRVALFNPASDVTPNNLYSCSSARAAAGRRRARALRTLSVQQYLGGRRSRRRARRKAPARTPSCSATSWRGPRAAARSPAGWAARCSAAGSRPGSACSAPAPAGTRAGPPPAHLRHPSPRTGSTAFPLEKLF